MRCPKCGYISFDHMESCLKCKKAYSGGRMVKGTTYHAIAPSFLRVPEPDDPVEEELASFENNGDFAEDDYDFVDSDLDVFVGTDEDITFEEADDDVEGIAFADPDSADFQLEPDGEDEEISFDLDMDSDADVSVLEDEESLAPQIKIPDELANISDLSPASQENTSVSPPGADSMNMSLDNEMSLDGDVDLDGLDLDLGLGSADDTKDADLSLSLDDIKLSVDDITQDATGGGGGSLDLNLDGLDVSPAPKKEKSFGSLDDISLSLD